MMEGDGSADRHGATPCLVCQDPERWVFGGALRTQLRRLSGPGLTPRPTTATTTPRLPRGVAAAAKPKLTREAEPEEAWLSKAEKEGKSPFKDPLAISAILGLLVPFVILGIAIGTGARAAAGRRARGPTGCGN